MGPISLGLDVLTMEDLIPLKDAEFQVAVVEDGPADVSLTLHELREIRTQESRDRQPFSAVFRGDARRPLEQGTYWLSNPEIRLDMLFLVPIGQDAEFRRYEAIFN